MIKALHHNAYRCRDSEETRKFYEDFLGLRLAGALDIQETGGKSSVLHTFFQMDDGSFLAFFEAPDMPFEFKRQNDFDLHIALEVDEPTLLSMFANGKERAIETRGVIDHGMVHSIYFRLRHRAYGKNAGPRRGNESADQRRTGDSRQVAGNKVRHGDTVDLRWFRQNPWV